MRTRDPSAEELLLTGARPHVAGRAYGPSGGTPVLALHGWLDNAASFAPLVPLLPGRRIVAVDLPGHGLSEHRGAGAGYAFVDWAADVQRILDDLGWERAVLLGHSMGAAIAALTAAVLPERVERLALIEGLAPFTNEPESAPDQLEKHLRQRRALAGKRRPVYPDVDAAMAARAAAGDFPSPELVRGIVERGLAPAEGGLTWRSDQRLTMASALRLTPEQAAAFLRRIACPTLIVRATRGLAKDLDAFRAQAALVRQATVVEVEGGHHIHLERPEDVARHVTAFLGGSGA